MEAASRTSLEPLPDLPVEAPLESAAPRAAQPAPSAPVAGTGAAAAAATPDAASDPSSTGITLLDPESLLLEGAVTTEPVLPIAAPPVVQAADALDLMLEDPAVVEELLMSPPPPPPKPPATPVNAPTLTPTAAAAPTPAAAATEPRAEVRVPIIKTASLSAAATKAAATKLAAASKRVGEAPVLPKPAAIAPPARPAPAPAPAPAKVSKVAAPGSESDGLAGWTNARAAAAPAPKPRSAPSPAPVPAAGATSKAAAKPAPGAAAPAAAAPPAASAPMDRDFIARNQVVERYLSGRLPLKGATEFEQFVHRHPEILDEIGLPERVNAGLRLLEASGKPEPWQEAPRPSWQKPQVTLTLAALVGVLAVALTVLTGTGAAKSHRIAELQKQANEQPLDPATSTREIRLMPSRSGASNSPAISIGGGGAQLADFKIDESRSPYHIFRVTIDRIDQGRVGVITNLVKDSNGHLRIALNSTALGPGNYQLTIEGLNWRGDPEPDSWVTIGIQR
jgi:hypothetical protein